MIRALTKILYLLETLYYLHRWWRLLCRWTSLPGCSMSFSLALN